MSEIDPDMAHYETAGYAVLIMSIVGLILWICTYMGLVQPGFIDATGIFFISVLFFIVGWWMTAVGSPERGS